MSKHLTSAECAAEFWRAALDEANITEGYNWPDMCGGWDADNEAKVVDRRKVLERFATLPHAHEGE